MRTPPSRSPVLEELLAPHRVVWPLPPAVAARALARAVRLTEVPDPAVYRPGRRPRWVFALATGMVLTLGMAAFAAGPWRPWTRPTESPQDDARLGGDLRPARRAWGRSARSVAQAPVAADTAAVQLDAPAVEPAHRRGSLRANARVANNAELQLLRQARRDVMRGDYGGALEQLGEHGRRFRNGSLVEEREALRVMSLSGLGRREEAQQSAAAFRARFPHSVFLPTFERMREAKR